MANQQLGGMKTLAQTMEVEGSPNQVFLDAFRDVEQLNPMMPDLELTLHPEAKTAKTRDIADLPISHYIGQGGKNPRTKTYVDVILDYQGILDEAAMLGKAKAR